jgi:hypothetical protein
VANQVLIRAQTGEHQIRSSLKAIEVVQPERYLNAVCILELANKAYSLYVRRDHAEKTQTPQNGTFELRD